MPRGTFKLRERHCGPGRVQSTTRIFHTPGNYKFFEKTFEEGTWTSSRHSSRRVAHRGRRERRERTPSPLTPMTDSDSSDGDSELYGEAAMRQ